MSRSLKVMGFAKSGSNRRFKVAAIAVLVAAILWVWPPFHVRKLDASLAPSTSTPSQFDAAAVATRMWAELVSTANAEAIDSAKLAAALIADPQAGLSLGHRTGLGGKTYFFVRGSGRVVEVDAAGVRIDIGVSGAEVLLKTGPIFGNAVRDGSGHFNIAAHTSIEANALSAELNRIAETVEQPELLRDAKRDAGLRFIACGEAAVTNGMLVLKLISIATETVP